MADVGSFEPSDIKMTDRTNERSQDHPGTARELISPKPRVDLVARLRGLLEKATPGPWRYKRDRSSDPDCVGGSIWPEGKRWTITDWADEPDALFIVEAVNSLPTLLDALAASEARAEALEKERENARKDRDAAETHWAEAIAETDRVRNHYIAKLLKAEAEVASLKARVAEVLEPFAKTAQDIGDWVGDDKRLDGWAARPAGDYRRAAELHAAMQDELK